jgi:hypothetical protein
MDDNTFVTIIWCGLDIGREKYTGSSFIAHHLLLE